MDRYQRVEKPRGETAINENEIRITAQGRIRNYISYAITLLQEKGSDEIIIKAMGRAINKSIVIVELIKRRVASLHQNTTIESIDIIDTWEPLEEGLLPLETTRHVSVISITLSKKELDTTSPGYQPPIPDDQVKPLADFGYGGISNGLRDYEEDGGWDDEPGYVGRGRGRGRGRGAFGRGRGYSGGYGGGYGEGYGGRDMPQESGGYDDDEQYAPPPQGRGRGRGGRTRGRGRGRGRGRD
ncbi:uncharacterized protein [Typha latifolia]|uniref:uncharacterized protein isoform X2 n=1 Tax=Typha latifolia TaxID=4733 RepID=UPI003C2C9875